MYNVYIGSAYSENGEFRICGYSIMILRKEDDTKSIFDLYYGAIIEEPYTGMKYIGSIVFGILKALKIIYGEMYNFNESALIDIHHSEPEMMSFIEGHNFLDEPLREYFKTELKEYHNRDKIDIVCINREEGDKILRAANMYAGAGIENFCLDDNQLGRYRRKRIHQTYERDYVIMKDYRDHNGEPVEYF